MAKQPAKAAFDLGGYRSAPSIGRPNMRRMLRTGGPRAPGLTLAPSAKVFQSLDIVRLPRLLAYPPQTGRSRSPLDDCGSLSRGIHGSHLSRSESRRRYSDFEQEKTPPSNGRIKGG